MTNLEDSDEEEPVEKPKPSPKPKRKSKKRAAPDSDGRYKIIRKALEEHLIEHARQTDKKRKSLDEITSTVEEFMDSFIILGYDYSGESVTLISANTQQQADSLSTLIQKFVVSSQGPAGPPFYD
tara:strand:+ start:310 stop:684 length:375 start_codon:yes stop_codon:yes gene_type:complete